MNSSNWIQHTLRHSEWRPTRTAVAIGTLCLFVAIIIGALYLSQSANSSAMGRQMEELVRERNNLEQANEQLRADIASLRGVGRLLTRAGELGFVPASQDQLLYIVIDGYNPNREQMVELPAETITQETAAPVYEESFIGWVQQQFDSLRQQLEGYSQETP
jgi:hypothetical protein